MRRALVVSIVVGLPLAAIWLYIAKSLVSQNDIEWIIIVNIWLLAFVTAIIFERLGFVSSVISCFFVLPVLFDIVPFWNYERLSLSPLFIDFPGLIFVAIYSLFWLPAIIVLITLMLTRATKP